MKVKVFTDGGARGNPGPAAYGYVIWKENEKLTEHGEFIGAATNNVAEYTGVLKALECVSLLHGFGEVDIFLDSQLVQRQMTGEYKIKNEELKKLATEIKKLEEKFDKVTYTHVRREGNKEADSLVNKALDQYLAAK